MKLYFPNKMPLKFAANISTLFLEHESLLDRFKVAQDHGFEAVECQFPYEFPVESVSKAKEQTSLKHVLINSFPGNSGELGFASRPHYEAEFRNSLDTSIKYAKALGCKKIHVMAGLKTKFVLDKEMEEVYIDNLKYAAKILEKEDIVGVIEPLAAVISPQYFLKNYDQALKVVQEVNHPNIKLLLDIFHLQLTSGNLTENINKLMPFAGHVQVSQTPRRTELDDEGEINYTYILNLFEQRNFEDYIGLEYKPSGQSDISLTWLQKSKFWG